MRRLQVALVAAAGLLAAGPIALGPAGSVAQAHSQLVSSLPGAGEVVATAPAEIRLVFSEPLDGRYSSADLLDQTGKTLLANVGAPDPDDPSILVIAVPALADGAYTVNWRALSAADGHQTSGFISFGVGNVDPATVPADAGGSTGSLHAGHDAGTALLEVQARTVGDLAFLLAFGLLIVALAVLRPAGLPDHAVARAQGWALAAAGAGSLFLGVLAGSAPGLDLGGYLAGTRPGQLLLARGVLGVTLAAATWLLLRRGRPRVAALITGIGGAAGLLLVALGGHASAFASPAPLAAMLVHLGAVGVWIAGLGALVTLAALRPDRARWLPLVVPRFSAVALVSIALVAATGAYSAWVETRDLLSLGTEYQVALAIKVALVIAALTIGAANYLAGGRDHSRAGGFGRRIAFEGLLAIGVLIATANLASGSPPAGSQPIPLAAAAGSVTAARIDLSLLPGHPGPNRLTVTTDAAGPHAGAVEVRLDRLDGTAGESVVPLRAVPGADGIFVATGIVLAPMSSWDATVVLRDHAGTETARRRFAFALGADALIAGVAGPALDPGLLVALALLVVAALAVAFALAGGAPPRVDPSTGRRSLLAGAAIAGVLGVVLLVWRVGP